MHVINANHAVNVKNFLLSAGTSGLLGEALKGTEITGNPTGDFLIKVVVPIISGVIAPLVKEWLETRREKRRLKKLQQKK